MRLNKWLAAAIGVSRREADEMIAKGRVCVGEQQRSAVLGMQISPSTEVHVDRKVVRPVEEFVYLAFHKPVGYVSSRRAQGAAPTLYELLPEKYRELKTVGRLDKDSSGLILLSNDGDFAHRMSHPSFAKVKVYEVGLDRPLLPMHQQMIADIGIQLKDGVSKLGLVELGSRKRWQVTMGEGRNRQIRRTFGALGYTVEKLHRTQFGKYELGGLEKGKWQEVKL